MSNIADHRRGAWLKFHYACSRYLHEAFLSWSLDYWSCCSNVLPAAQGTSTSSEWSHASSDSQTVSKFKTLGMRRRFIFLETLSFTHWTMLLTRVVCIFFCCVFIFQIRSFINVVVILLTLCDRFVWSNTGGSRVPWLRMWSVFWGLWGLTGLRKG